MLFYFFWVILQTVNDELKMLSQYKLYLILFFLFLAFNSAGQNILAQESKSKEAQKVFLRIEEGFNSVAVDKFSNYFSAKNYFSFNGGTTGYYSSNQSYYVIKDFLSIYQPISFKLTNIVTETASPFASGNLRYSNKGIKGNAIVFISLQWIDNRWRISQITIN
jgi:hypothetical protein